MSPEEWEAADKESIRVLLEPPPDPRLAQLAALIVPGLLARWEARRGGALGPHVIHEPRDFAIAEARLIARRLLAPPDARLERTMASLVETETPAQDDRAALLARAAIHERLVNGCVSAVEPYTRAGFGEGDIAGIVGCVVADWQKRGEEITALREGGPTR